ncbi:putative Cation channel sperm-associated protein 2 [Paratrimastix pyriformis]|uniref:Cation channel sperm-associated protein 2 n=1 Tax=Paratrimastix pyriformis TaxID=342808 RepID=A0ABQ8UVN4_9EUKA|nr:putative Cation channel sperm-associated protein 2 [Paratrimastix pyriformis]
MSAGFSHTDLSARCVLFRSKLIEEFRLSDNIAYNTKDAPVLTTTDIIKEPDLFKQTLRDTPNQLIKFKIFKRGMTTDASAKDRRMTRTKAMNTIPIGVWAWWFTNTSLFNYVMTIVIIFNAVMLGVQGELPEEQYPAAQEVFRVLDLIVLYIFIVEIILKLLDNPIAFWRSGWNWFDLAVTIASLVPEVVTVATTGQLFSVAGMDQYGFLKTLRTFRTLRTLKMLSRFRSLQIIVNTVMNTFKNMVFILLLLLLVMYIFAIFGISLFDAYTWSTRADLLYQYKFSSLGWSFVSLFQLLTLDHWYGTLMDYMKVGSTPFVTILYFLAWVWVGAFLFRNIFIGVMVQDFQDEQNKMIEQAKAFAQSKKMDSLRKRLTTVLPDQRGATARGAMGASLGASALMHSNLAGPARAPAGSLALSELPRRIDQSIYVEKGDQTFVLGKTIGAALRTLSAKKVETDWPRDSLFRYLQTMENLQVPCPALPTPSLPCPATEWMLTEGLWHAAQENMKEYQELQLLAAQTLLDLHDT